MVTIFILILATKRSDIFSGKVDILTTIILLGFFPVLAYPLQKIIPPLRKRGREGQRSLAFLFSLIGYATAFFWALLYNVTAQLLLICATYFFSVIILTFFNKVIHIRASGHACSFTGPLILLIYFTDIKVLLPSLFIAALIIWSSIYLKRHTPRELAAGISVCMISFLLALFLVPYMI